MSAVKIIRSEPIHLDSLDHLTNVYKDLASLRPADGAALVQCGQFLPPNAGFPPSTTKFHRPNTVSFLNPNRATSNKQDFLQIDPFTKHPRVVYQQPDRFNAPEGIMSPEDISNAIELVFKDRMKAQTRLIMENEDNTNSLLKVGHPLSECSTPIFGVTKSQGLVSFGKSVSEVILGDWGLGWSSLLIAGASGLFIIIAPGSNTVFEDALKTAFGIDKKTCSQFLRHFGIFPSLSFLRHHNVEFSLMQQRVGDVAIIFPGTYCYGIDTGTNYSENISWATDDWDPARVEYKSCSKRCGAKDIITRPTKRRCNLGEFSLQPLTTNLHHVTGLSQEMIELGPDAISSSQLPENEQDCQIRQETTASEDSQVGEGSRCQLVMSHSLESPSTDEELSKTPQSTRTLGRRAHDVFTLGIPSPVAAGGSHELSSFDGLHERVKEYLELSKREASANEKRTIEKIERYWARLQSEQAERRRGLPDF
ncbi:transcription factor jumonjihydroxylase [Fusarium phyllophilum]|uniref:Transcription factor jumonjihydroxylase n=1 Tax=Fusarium phyllophilum TaxID=47803 RepID=A0A8H5JXQ7_9HYPO|nr:transcription factor jumonjihydroxylase [Fusarium phyllophilum]